ncbi:hypothetical protein [Archangium violaceum]|uniref:hypothetical protein n=1 Tax=Archangium violaceum TaxID=83451 RepID=UPI0036DC7710
MLRILDARGVRVVGVSRRRILRCTDLATLDQWFERALHADRLSEVLDGSGISSHPGTRKRTARAKTAAHS